MQEETQDVSMTAVMTDGQRLVAMLEAFIGDNYQVRRNVVTDTFEYRKLPSETDAPWFRLTETAFNAMVVEARRAGIDGSIRQVMRELIFTDDATEYNPVRDYLDHLPEWDGKDRIERLFLAIPGITAEQTYFACRWYRSCVAHWYGMDTMYGNQTVLMLIGAQGCGKSTFAQRILPPELRHLYLDHLNLSNKNDKEMALSNNMLVNIDEIDQVTPAQQASLKQVLTKSRVNGRKIYGRNQELRERIASFVATTNNPHPLKDPTGSRRYLVIKVADGKSIDNTSEIDYQQLMAQALHEVRESEMPYWFNDDEVRRIQVLNTAYQEERDLESIVCSFVRKPEVGESVSEITTKQLLVSLSKDYPVLPNTKSIQTRLGVVMRQLGIERRHTRCGSVYSVVMQQPA